MFEWIVAHPIAYPALEVIHIVGIAILLGNLLLFELRVWGFGPDLPVRPLARLALRLSLVGFALAALSGLLMLAGQVDDMLANQAFLVKIGLLVLAGLNAAWFHSRSSLVLLDGVARAQTLISTGLWLGVIICGRWIAYL